MGARVDEQMSTSVLTTTPETRAVDAALVVALRDITALPVLENGRVVGMFSEADLTSSSSPQSTLTVGEVMGPVRLTTTPGADSDEIADAMARLGVTSVPVIEEGKLVGIITRRDLISKSSRTP
jgi:CBS domain-containing protein